MQVFDRMAAGLLAVILLFICPVVLTLQRQQAMTELAVMEVVSSCTEQWKQSGQITLQSYEKVVEQLALLGQYQLEIDHRRRVLEPQWKEEEIVEVTVAYLYVPWDDVYQKLYGTEGYYQMYQGDKLTVIVRGMGNSGDKNLWSRLFGSGTDSQIQYGGIITGETDESGAVGWNTGTDILHDRNSALSESAKAISGPDQAG